MSEPRSAARAPHQCAVRVRCETWQEYQALYTRNLSRGGLFLATDRPPPVLTPVHLQIILPDGRQLRLEGRVAHTVVAARAQTDGATPGMGVELVHLEADMEAALEALVDETREIADIGKQSISSRKPATNTRLPRAAIHAPGSAPAVMEAAVLRDYLNELYQQSSYQALDVTPETDDQEVYTKYEALAGRFSPPRVAEYPLDVRVISAEIAILLQRAYETITSQRLSVDIDDFSSDSGLGQPPAHDGRADFPAGDPLDPFGTNASRSSDSVPSQIPDRAAVYGPEDELSAGTLFGDLDLSEERGAVEMPAPAPRRGTSGRTVRSPADWHRTGLTLLSAQRFREARDMIQRALDGDSANPLFQRDLQLVLALEQRQAGNFEDAAQMLTRVLEMDPKCQAAVQELRTLLDQRKIRKSPTLARLLG